MIGVNEVRELFNAALANFCQNPVTEPPVMDIKMDSTGELGSTGVCGGDYSAGQPSSFVLAVLLHYRAAFARVLFASSVGLDHMNTPIRLV